MSYDPTRESERARQRELERRLTQLQTSNAGLARTNEQLVGTLKTAKTEIEKLREEIDRIAAPPSTFGVVITRHDEDGTADIFTGGRKMRVAISTDIPRDQVRLGREVRLNEALVIVGLGEFERTGEVVMIKDRIGTDRLVVLMSNDEEKVVRVAESLADERLRIGDAVLLDTRTMFAIERMPHAEVTEVVLEEVPDISYADIGGLRGQIEQIRDAVEMPFLHPGLYREHHLKPPKGVLLYGPPGCGKTLIAKAVAASLARQVAERDGLEPDAQRSYFLNIKGPELLNKYVGETERHIRLVFERAREKADEGTPVVVFFDEMDSLFRTRGSGVSSDVETTIVPQLLAEIDGVETLENVIVIGASNREDMIDPAILRPGRLDVKIKIERPDQVGAREIFGKYLTPAIPIHADVVAAHGGSTEAAATALIDQVMDDMYATTDANRFLEVTYASGTTEVLYFRDFASGAMIQNIVDRAKTSAIKAFLTTGERGITFGQLRQAYLDEFRQNEDLPNTTNPDDWARVSGRRGERIVHLRTFGRDD
ncbi:proteasome ATPase [Arsenicicoccus piscis]|uniref:AAA ATPase forming ring-shaped complexes n=1 Tax=Arsenicicoccus piscis TaxID=673954 RepID=A0ABQ6HWY0_9MICO|nr:proteasome ATPase [Arsenicicoccus piscis]MCH8629295.1 proteasome ATPase [Arsenicicoccus piscis]GMA19743.1 proteasome-associated ATPase [Arsenicicoccus piscis]GMA22039.1 proteasome-associated ATPase [Arsenicicoccus piscis]